MAYFHYRGSRSGDRSVNEEYVIENSATVARGGWVRIDGGAASPAGAGERLLGVVHDIVTKDGVPLGQHQDTEIDGTYTENTGSTADTYAADSDNETDAKVKVQVNIDREAIYANTPDSSIGTTTGSDEAGNYTDLADDTQVDEDTVDTSASGNGQLNIHGVDPIDSGKGLYSVAEYQEVI